MNAETNNIELIESYLFGRCTPQESRAIARRISEDPAFAKQVAEYRILFSGLKEIRLQKLEAEIAGMAAKSDDLPDEKAVEELELIEKYYKGKLTGKALEDFERRRKTDAEFAQKVTEYQVIFSGLREARIKEIEQEIGVATGLQTKKKISKQVIDIPQKSRIRKLIPVLALAATILFAIATLPFILVSDAQYETALLTTFGEEPNHGPKMGVEDSSYESIRNHFHKKEYSEALALLAEKEPSDTSTVYLGDIQFMKNNFDLAIVHYEKLSNSTNPELANKADWFIVQSLLKQQPLDKNRLLKQLSKIIDTKEVHNYKKPAKALKKRLESPIEKWKTLVGLQ